MRGLVIGAAALAVVASAVAVAYERTVVDEVVEMKEAVAEGEAALERAADLGIGSLNRLDKATLAMGLLRRMDQNPNLMSAIDIARVRLQVASERLEDVDAIRDLAKDDTVFYLRTYGEPAEMDADGDLELNVTASDEELIAALGAGSQ